MLFSSLLEVSAAKVGIALITVSLGAVLTRIVYNLCFHPLAGFPGPWYAASTSLASTIISLRRVEPQWLMGLVEKYGTDRPIRIAPTMLLFPKTADLKEIYWDPACNLKSELYGTGALGPPNLFSTRDGAKHRQLRKALGGTQKMSEFAAAREEIIISDKVAEFAADTLTMLAFSEPWGFIRNSRDERAFLKSWREGLNYFGMAARWQWYRNAILKNALLAPYFLPNASDKFGMGYLIAHADDQVTRREKAIEAAGDDWKMDKPDLLQHCLDARYDDGSPLNAAEKRAHATILIQAGADTTGTALGCTLRFLLTHPNVMRKARAEVDAAEKAGKLSDPISYEESRTWLPYLGACIKESLRLNPPAPNLFARVVPEGGKCIGTESIPAGTDITSNAYVVQRDPALYGPDPEVYRPERWLESPDASKMETGMFVFGTGPRICIGRDIATMELSKLLPEIIRNFEFKVLDVGKYVVAGGVAFNQDLRVVLTKRPQTI
ncbi:hypothetical protein DL769_000231 [Monosporascus sp. CRB-8-3]|nr:hypothetical protein DL769_000231 [Monosporascus sp. CRB-8-3]